MIAAGVVGGSGQEVRSIGKDRPQMPHQHEFVDLGDTKFCHVCKYRLNRCVKCGELFEPERYYYRKCPSCYVFIPAVLLNKIGVLARLLGVETPRPRTRDEASAIADELRAACDADPLVWECAEPGCGLLIGERYPMPDGTRREFCSRHDGHVTPEEAGAAASRAYAAIRVSCVACRSEMSMSGIHTHQRRCTPERPVPPGSPTRPYADPFGASA